MRAAFAIAALFALAAHAAPPAPRSQSGAETAAKSGGCLGCHAPTDAPTMHRNPAVQLGCTDCHGGDAKVLRGAGVKTGTPAYAAALAAAHVAPRDPAFWAAHRGANPERSYALLNRESPEFIRFMNPSDYRVAREACGSCHLDTIVKAERSMMATGAMLWGGAAYANGILPNKQYLLGEAYTRDGEPAALTPALPLDDAARKRGALPRLDPLPAWETVPPGDVFRVFERGGRVINSGFPETGLPNSSGQIQRLDEPGRPDLKQSLRGPGTGARVAIPVLNIHKTRLNDPNTWFLGTNDQPGDYRSSGCASCHVVYANDRDPRHSGPYARGGHAGLSAQSDPTIPRDEPGHPLQHAFTRAIPTSQCMICHMHQPNMFMNTFLGYTMWDYESDAPKMWPAEQRYPDDATVRRINDRNPEAAAARGLWGELKFLSAVADLNPTLVDTQFADYHGHGWNFRGVYKRDRHGALLDAKGAKVAADDPKKFSKAVHLSSVHVDVGMHCVDCHFGQDSHGDGHLIGEVAAAVEIDCKDCHGTVDAYPTLRTSGTAAAGGGHDLALLRNPDGRRRFEWIGGKLVQRSMLDPAREWTLSLVKDSVDPRSPAYNAKAARAKLMSRDTATQAWGQVQPAGGLAHGDDKLECYTCHTSWTTSCSGCHLPIEANWKTARHHYEDTESRNFATYNPQVARDDMFMLGINGTPQGNKVAPVRSSSGLVLSSTNANRERIYVQQPPISAAGYSSQVLNTHYPHTERKTETKTCCDCHLARADDNNAIMAQLLLQGTNYTNFIGRHAWLGGDGGVQAVAVTEWDEPQAVIGSYLQRYAYPDWYQAHQERGRELQVEQDHGAGGPVRCLQLRGEYLFAAEGEGGLRVYDVASIDNKGVAQKIISAPFSGLGHDSRLDSRDATCVALPSTQPIHPPRNQGELMRVANQEQPMHALFRYAFITDAEEGLILVDVDAFADGEPRNNVLERALTWNEGGVLDGARHLTIGGRYLYVMARAGLVVLDIDDPLHPKTIAKLPLDDARASALQFRYLWVTDAKGLALVDVTDPRAPALVAGARVPLRHAGRVYLARTWAYVADGPDGLAIVDVERPRAMKLHLQYTADGKLEDVRDVVIGATNASSFAYLADGAGGLKVLQLTAPDTQPDFYGFSPVPKPQLIAWRKTRYPALALSEGLERDRGADESGNQIALFGRLGARPLRGEELRRIYLDRMMKPWFTDDVPAAEAVRSAGGGK